MTQSPAPLIQASDDACDLATVDQVAALLKTSPSWVYKRTCDATDPLPCLKLRGALRFRLPDVERWLEAHTKTPPTQPRSSSGVVRRAPRIR